MDNKELWKSILLRIEPTIKKVNFLTWFQSTAILKKEEEKLYIGVPSTFAHDWLANKYHVKILQAAQEVDLSIKEIEYEVHSSLSDKTDTRRIEIKKIFKNSIKKLRKLPNKAEISVMPGVSSKILNSKYTLDNYITGKENHLAQAVCQAVAQNPGALYSPLFIYGGVGLGKTHLLQATGNQIVRNDPSKVVVYMTSEKFVNEIVRAIGNKKTKSFKDRYRNVDCFIIDDIQFLANKNSTQEEFFHTFNELYDNNKQIIISSDKPPKELKGLIEERLVSRFQMGMIVDVVVPEFETRLSILHNKCQEHQMILAPDLLEFIAGNVETSIRELEGILLQTIARAKVTNSTPTIRTVTELFQKLNGTTNKNQIQEVTTTIETSEDVVSIVANHFHLEKSDLTGSARRKEIMIPRQICMYLIRKELEKSFESIGDIFGGRSHTTVMHACSKIRNNLPTDQKLTHEIHSIKQAMGL